MMIEKDYVMRLIYEVIRALLRMIFHVDIEKKNGYLFEEEQRRQRYEELTGLVEQGKINEAENLLFQGMNVYEQRDLELALYFYAYLNEKDQEFLESHDFSRREVAEGIRLVCRLYGFETMAESLLDEIDME